LLTAPFVSDTGPGREEGVSAPWLEWWEPFGAPTPGVPGPCYGLAQNAKSARPRWSGRRTLSLYRKEKP